MIGRGRLTAMALASLCALAGGAAAQTAGPDEAVKQNGIVAENWSLTPAQRVAIYNAVVGQRVKPHPAHGPVAVGMPAPQAAELPELPTQAGFVGPAGRLKYGLIGGAIFIVDSLEMRVVAIIRRPSARRQ